MRQYSEPETFKLNHYSAEKLMPVSWLQDEWNQNRFFAWDLLEDETLGLNRTEKAIAPLLSMIMLFSITMLYFSLQLSFLGQRDSSNASLNPLVFISGLLCVAATFFCARINRKMDRLRNTADLTVNKIVNNWIRKRYGVDFDCTDDLVHILVDEPVKRPQERPYYLDIISVNGVDHLIVRNSADYTEAYTIYN
jgi:hypothetical protein